MPDIIQKSYAIEGKNSLHEENVFELNGGTELRGTEADEKDMQMLGRLQQLNVFDPHIIIIWLSRN